MEKSWEITLSDGTQLKNLGLNGNNFVSDKKIHADVFNGKLSNVSIKGKIEGNAFKQEYNNLELIQIAHYEDGYYFALREIPQEELDKLKMQSDIEYIAMMSDIDMEEEM